jgi:hypothetical protein
MKLPHQMRPANRYARESGVGRTLGQLVLAKMALVAVCRRCKHRRVLYAPKRVTNTRDDKAKHRKLFSSAGRTPISAAGRQPQHVA